MPEDSQNTDAQDTPYVFDVVREAELMRSILLWVEERARTLIKAIKENPPAPNTTNPEFTGEVIANAILALRHLEDSRMRYGKCIQYAPTPTQGQSIYPR